LRGTQIAGVSHFIAISIFLVRVEQGVAVVAQIADAVVIGVVGGGGEFILQRLISRVFSR
jgi:hypothetical protein